MPECHSTNTLAHELSERSSLEDGAVVITDNQTAGRGQRGNQWNSKAGDNLTFSIFLKPAFLLAKDQFFLNIITSLAIHDLLLDKANAGVKIKWPNDILMNGKKLCGILIENQIRGPQVSSSIVGIGLNVNQTDFSLPNATSVLLSSGKSFDLSNMLNDLLLKFEIRYLQLKQNRAHLLKEEYLSNLYWLNEVHLFASQGTPFEGTIKEIDVFGRLGISTPSGNRYFDIKEISFLQ